MKFQIRIDVEGSHGFCLPRALARSLSGRRSGIILRHNNGEIRKIQGRLVCDIVPCDMRKCRGLLMTQWHRHPPGAAFYCVQNTSQVVMGKSSFSSILLFTRHSQRTWRWLYRAESWHHQELCISSSLQRSRASLANCRSGFGLHIFFLCHNQYRVTGTFLRARIRRGEWSPSPCHKTDRPSQRCWSGDRIQKNQVLSNLAWTMRRVILLWGNVTVMSRKWNQPERAMSLQKASLKLKPESRTIRIETSGSYVTTNSESLACCYLTEDLKNSDSHILNQKPFEVR